jgi:hypothetical protein
VVVQLLRLQIFLAASLSEKTKKKGKRGKRGPESERASERESEETDRKKGDDDKREGRYEERMRHTLLLKVCSPSPAAVVGNRQLPSFSFFPSSIPISFLISHLSRCYHSYPAPARQIALISPHASAALKQQQQRLGERGCRLVPLLGTTSTPSPIHHPNSSTCNSTLLGLNANE